MAFATVEDVATAQRKSLDAEDTATVSYLLDVATKLIKDYTEQEIEAFDDVEETTRAVNGVWLVSELPIRALAVEVEGALITDYDVDWNAGIIKRHDGYWNTGDEVVITYDSGYDPIPASIQGVCVDVVKRAFENPAGLQRDDLNTASQWLGLTAENKLVLDRYKI